VTSLWRRLRQLAGDPVLRRWLLERAIGRTPAPPNFRIGHPPYLPSLGLVDATPDAKPQTIDPAQPIAPIELPLAGERVRVEPVAIEALFERTWSDIETLLSLHRFAWLPILGRDVDPAWVAALLQRWRARFGTPENAWPWHPYTVAERAINLLDFARLVGWPGGPKDYADFFITHARIIAERLEYFGPHYTGNHLSNNGRGLFRIGLALGWKDAADRGGRILLEEAKRLFGPAGMLNEGSSHYHLLLARNYVDAWRSARAAGRPETAGLERIAAGALAAIPNLVLPGGLALVGDISPDCPPDFLMGLAPQGPPGGGWLDLLEPTERDAVRELRDAATPIGPDEAQGWLKAEFGKWSGLWQASPEGWAPMPGHGHQDLGSFELHWMDKPLFIDPGRGAYGETGPAAHYRSGAAHNGLLIDDADPMPPNRPYYHPEFRRKVGGPPPVLRRAGDGVDLKFFSQGFAVSRRWRFLPQGLSIEDSVQGTGRHRLARRLHTDWSVERAGDGVRLASLVGRFVVRAQGTIRIEPVTRWTAYGVGSPATVLVIEDRAKLPWRSRIEIAVDG